MDLTVAGDVTISNSSELYLGQGGSGIGTINIAGNLSVNTATITETGSATGYLVLFNKVGTQTFSATAATLANNINYTVAATSTLVLNNSLPINNVGNW
ncbi:MAG: hypothetical protein IPL50_20135 [Chitinophagaceae bacterium]|nr:hypothetical protein [Chitinophagaceae bacterium]